MFANSILTVHAFGQNVLNLILKAWIPEDVLLYGERYSLVCKTEAGLARPLMRYSAAISLQWFKALMGGTQQEFADTCFVLVKIILDLCDDSTDAYALVTDEVRAAAKPLMVYPMQFASDAIMNTPGFSWDLFKGGDTLVEVYYSYDYDQHHGEIVDLCSNDNFLFGSLTWLLIM